MKNLNLILATVLFALFALTSCEKEGLEEMTASQNIEITNELVDTSVTNLEADDAIELADATVQGEQATSRNAITLLSSNTFDIERGDWNLVYFASQNIPNPDDYKIEVVVTPISGTTDLKIYGWNREANNPWRLVRKSTPTVSQHLYASFRKTGLKRNEERMYIAVQGRTNARFKIEIYKRKVMCVEYKPVEPVSSSVIRPVCTCEGTSFANPGEAFNLGYTSWTNGPCRLKDGVYENWLLGNSNANIHIEKIQISGDGRYVKVQSTACSNGINNYCIWDRAIVARHGVGYIARFREGNLKATLLIHMEGDLMQIEYQLDYVNGGGVIQGKESLLAD